MSFTTKAVSIVAEAQQASVSMVQRRLRIGYNRASRLVEKMEQEGIVGPADGAKPRAVLIQSTLSCQLNLRVESVVSLGGRPMTWILLAFMELASTVSPEAVLQSVREKHQLGGYFLYVFSDLCR